MQIHTRFCSRAEGKKQRRTDNIRALNNNSSPMPCPCHTMEMMLGKFGGCRMQIWALRKEGEEGHLLLVQPKQPCGTRSSRYSICGLLKSDAKQKEEGYACALSM